MSIDVIIDDKVVSILPSQSKSSALRKGLRCQSDLKDLVLSLGKIKSDNHSSHFMLLTSKCIQAFLLSLFLTGKVLVHCEKGYSRSPTVVLIYLALKVHMRIPMALKMCCSQRNICPNDGFLNQLSMLDNCMRNA